MTEGSEPYAPPSARLDASPALPKLLLAAISLFSLGVLVGLFYLFETQGFTLSRMFSASLICFLGFLICRGIRRARPWARWIVVTMAAVVVVSAPSRFANREALYLATFIPQLVCFGVAGLILLLPSSTAWFARTRA